MSTLLLLAVGEINLVAEILADPRLLLATGRQDVIAQAACSRRVDGGREVASEKAGRQAVDRMVSKPGAGELPFGSESVAGSQLRIMAYPCDRFAQDYCQIHRIMCRLAPADGRKRRFTKSRQLNLRGCSTTVGLSGRHEEVSVRRMTMRGRRSYKASGDSPGSCHMMVT